MIDNLPRSLFSEVRRVATSQPSKIALWCDDESIAYADLVEKAECLALALQERGVKSGETVGVILPNGVAFVLTILAASALGLAIAPFNTTMSPQQLRSGLAAASAKHVVCLGDQIPAVDGLRIALVAADACVVSFASLLDQGSQLKQRGAIVSDDEYLSLPYVLTMTSGSTGSPKPIVLLQKTKWLRAQAAIRLYKVSPDDVVLAATPLYHSLAERLLFVSLLLGCTLVLMNRYSPSYWVRVVKEHRVTFTIAVSSQLKGVLPLLLESAGPLPLKTVVSSSAPISNGLKKDLLELTAFDFHECYGTSEIAIATNLDVRLHVGKLESVGIPLPEVQLKIMTASGEEAKVGEAGEILINSVYSAAGYLSLPELTSRAWQGGYFRTGDLGRLDADGFLYFLGRTKELIITGGINVYPVDIEIAAKRFAGVRDAVACGVPDSNLGEVVGLALQVDREGGFDFRRFRHHCAIALADFQQPRRIRLFEALPLTEIGKVDRRRIQDSLAREE